VLSALVLAPLVWAVPSAALAAVPHSPGSNAEHPSPGRAGVPNARRRATGITGLTPVFKCEKPGTSHTVKVTVDLSGVKETGTYSTKHKTDFSLTVKGTPKFTLKLGFAGDVTCTGAVYYTAPLADTPFLLKIGPKLTFSAEGEVDASFTWSPYFDLGLKFAGGHLTHSLTVKNGGGMNFTGSGTASLWLALDATVETPKKVAGVEVTVGPQVSATITADSGSHSICWSGSLTGDIELQGWLHVFRFVEVKLDTKETQIGKAQKLTGGCTTTAPTIVFDGSPGTGAPPATLGPYTMQPFAADPTAEGTLESEVTGPTGPISFDSQLQHDLVGSDWETWSNGYTGDVYENDTALPDGDFEVTVTLPPGTGAFYAYAEPDEFEDFDMSATAQDGTTSGPLTVYGEAGAQYFGFYATCGHTLQTVTFTDSGGDQAMAVGEFGIAPECRSGG
jgi:hypothetical protein